MDSGKMKFAKKWVADYINGRRLSDIDPAKYEAIVKHVFTGDEIEALGGLDAVKLRVVLGERDPEAHKVTVLDVKHVLNQPGRALLHTGGHGRSGDMRGLTGQEFWAKIAEQRQMLLSPESIENIQAAYDWIRKHLRQGCRMNYDRTSYGLKHVMEGNNRVYVTNGEFIVAMLLAGYKMSMTQYNPSFNVMESDVKAIIKRNKVTA